MNNDTFSKLNKDTISEIALRLDPESVLKLCDTDKKLREICKKPETFKILLNSHYPGLPHTDDPRKQYMALTYGKSTTYYTELKILYGTSSSKSEEEYNMQLFEEQEPFHTVIKQQLVILEKQMSDEYKVEYKINNNTGLPFRGIVKMAIEIPGLKLSDTKLYLGTSLSMGYTSGDFAGFDFHVNFKCNLSRQEVEQYLYQDYVNVVNINVDKVLAETILTRKQVIELDFGLDINDWDDYKLFLKRIRQKGGLMLNLNQEYRKVYQFKLTECFP